MARLPLKNKNRIEISLPQYVMNPYRGSGNLAPRYMIRRALNDSFVDLLSKYRRQFYAVPYVKDTGEVMLHVRIPSGNYSSNKLHYDVIFVFDSDDKRPLAFKAVKMFSNAPSFLYTYAYVYYHHSLIPDFMAPKLPMIAMTTPPTERNPMETLGFERTTYMAARYIIDGKVLTDSYINKFKQTWNDASETKLFNEIASPEKMVELYNFAKQLEVKKPRKPMLEKERARKKTEINKFKVTAKRTAPKQGFRAPRSKITARKAKKKL